MILKPLKKAIESAYFVLYCNKFSKKQILKKRASLSVAVYRTSHKHRPSHLKEPIFRGLQLPPQNHSKKWRERPIPKGPTCY